MLPPGTRVGVAVSGGADSLCLLHVLHALSGRLSIELHVMHLNHSLRGGESDEDEREVLALAGRLGLPALSERWRPPAAGENLEQAAREARYAFFMRAMQDHSLQRVATGHTLSDQAETVLFRMLRGTAPAGLAAIRPVTSEGIVRPLIEISRDEVRTWLTAQGIPWREDSTNQDLSLARNRIRSEVLPMLSAVFNPGAEEALARLASLSAEDEDYWDRLLDAQFEGVHVAKPPFVVDTSLIVAPHPALARRIIRRLLSHAAASSRRFTQQHIEAVWELASRVQGSGRVLLPRVEVQRSFQQLRFSTSSTQRVSPVETSLCGPGTVTIFGRHLEVSEEKRLVPVEATPPDCRYNETGELLDADRVVFPLLIRGWKPGDAYQPHGFGSEVRLKDLFGLARIPSWDRHDWPIIESGERIVWCRRFGSASWAAAGSATLRRLRVRELSD